MRKAGLADALGIIAGLVAIAWLPGSADPLTYIKLLFLTAGGLAVAPAAFARWRAAGTPQAVVLVPLGAAAELIAWGLISTVGSGAPVWNSHLGN